MPVAILHFGLPLDHSSIPVEDAPRIAARLDALCQRMRAAGYEYTVAHASPEAGMEELRRQLRAQPFDGLLLGGGVAGNPELRLFTEEIINAAHEVRPGAKIMFYDHAVDVLDIVRRWFPSPASE